MLNSGGCLRLSLEISFVRSSGVRRLSSSMFTRRTYKSALVYYTIHHIKLIPSKHHVPNSSNSDNSYSPYPSSPSPLALNAVYSKLLLFSCDVYPLFKFPNQPQLFLFPCVETYLRHIPRGLYRDSFQGLR